MAKTAKCNSRIQSAKNDGHLFL